MGKQLLEFSMQRVAFGSILGWAIALPLLPRLAELYATSTYSHFDYGPWNVRVDSNPAELVLANFPLYILLAVLLWRQLVSPGMLVSQVLQVSVVIYYGFILFTGGFPTTPGLSMTMLNGLILSLIVVLAFWDRDQVNAYEAV
ncbi:MAG: hypothetical protein H7A35_11665 [Planctomycetales bacterium]|nr:hypothetical protein [bacterium]UNM07516.1 MAG: hypothetical protein H7A35_11665 [Planctomycetales bacterium]